MKKLISLMILVACAMLVVACADDEDGGTSSGNGTPCDPTTDTQTCTNDLTQVLECRYVEDSASNEWVPVKTCNVNFGEYCRLLANGTFSCRDDSSTTDSGDTTPTDTGDSAPTDTGDSVPTDTGDSEPTDTGDSEPTDTGDSEPTDTGDSEPTDTGDSGPDTGDPGVCTDCDGSGVKITGTVTLFHPTALPSSTYSGLGGVQDGSEYFPPCETSVTLGEKSVYGTLVVNINTKHIATVEEFEALSNISGTERFIQVNHSVAGEMGSVAYPKYSTGITMSYFQSFTNSDTGETETDFFIDDMDLINGNISTTYAIRIICSGATVQSGIKKIGPYNGDDCILHVLNFATNSSDACWHALGVSDPDLVNDGLTFTVQ
ncbi:hypothetical protein IKR20_04060 [bacterium]|nr:hypothetical protein [bacterium]